VTQSIQINPTPTLITLASKPTICAGGSSSLYVAGANSYSWNTGASGSSISVTPSVTSIYTVTGFYLTGCNNTQTISVSLFEPVIGLNGPTVACSGSTISLTASGANSYTWNTGSHSATISVSPTISTIYSISATSSSNTANCTGSNTIGVIINPTPTVTAFATNPEICRGESAVLTATGALTYTWLTLQASNSVTVSPLIPTSYTVQGMDTNGCLDTAIVFVKINLCAGIYDPVQAKPDKIIIYPNPNSGEFIIHAEIDANLNMVDQFGRNVRVFSFTELNAHRETVKELPPGVYFITGYTNERNINYKIIVSK
jgi:hypothetical protein